MEYTPLSQFCAIWLIVSFLWGKISTIGNFGKTVGEVRRNSNAWCYSPLWVFVKLTVGVFVVIGTGFFYQIQWPQILWFITAPLGMIVLMMAAALLGSGKHDHIVITYEPKNLFGDACAILLFCFGHAYGPLGLNPWPLQ